MIGKSAKGDRGGVGVAGNIEGDVTIGIDPAIALDAKDRLIANLEKQLKKLKKTQHKLRKADAGKHQAELILLQQQIAELQRRLDNPEQVQQELLNTIAKLEGTLTREVNDIGEARMTEAREALDAGDFSVADGIFAEIEAREQLAVERIARAAFAQCDYGKKYRHAPLGKFYCSSLQNCKESCRVSSNNPRKL